MRTNTLKYTIIAGLIVLIAAGIGRFFMPKERGISLSENNAEQETLIQDERQEPLSQTSEYPAKKSSPQPYLKTEITNTLEAQFFALEKEITAVETSRTFFSDEHYDRIMRDLYALELQGFTITRILNLRERASKLESPRHSASNFMKWTETKCESNPSPVFTHHITDIRKVDYIAPPPTMGAGPSLKTHSYIGTERVRVPVYAPTALTLKMGSYYVGGPYMFELNASCEVTVRFGHITEPVDAIKKLFPSEPAQDSRMNQLAPLTFAAGELLGYTTGTEGANSAGNWDFGVYNSSAPNRYANDPTWGWSTTYTTAVCPFDYFLPNLKSEYTSRFNLAKMGGNPPHGESFCK